MAIFTIGMLVLVGTPVYLAAKNAFAKARYQPSKFRHKSLIQTLNSRK